jgi:ATP-binding cassette subfamily C protein
MLQADYQKFLGQEDSLWLIRDNIDKAAIEQEVHNTSANMAPDTPRDIGFEDVTFRYQDKTVFEKLSLIFPARKVTVLKGESGRGKTTCIDMICSLSAPQAGRIMIGDTPLADINTRSWRGKIGYVDQFPFLFKGSIRQNILLDITDMDDAAVYACLEKCHLRAFVESLDGGLYFQLSEGGTNISGGQRQRIAIARAIIHKPLYLIMDEPTSALDQDTAEMVFKTLQELKAQMSVIVISHSAEIERYADHVISL